MSERYLIQHMDGRVDITGNGDCPDGARLRRIAVGAGETAGAYVLSEASFDEVDPCPVLLLRHSANDADKQQLAQLISDRRSQSAAAIPGLAAKAWVDDVGYLTLEGEEAMGGTAG